MTRPALLRTTIAAALAVTIAAAPVSAAPALAVADPVVVTVADTAARPDGSTPFTGGSAWRASAVVGVDGQPTVYSTTAGATATWTLPAPEAGVYRVEAAVPDASNSEPGAVYAISGGSGGPTTTTVDQTARRGEWVGLGWLDLDAGELATATLRRQATVTSVNTRAGSVRLVADPDGVVPEPVESGLPFAEDWSAGVGDWSALAGSTADWSTGSAEFDYLAIDNRSGSSGSYLRPAAALALPEGWALRTSLRVDGFGASGTATVLVDVAPPYSHVANNTAVQLTPSGIKIARPNSGATVCTGQAPFETGEWMQLEVVHAAGVLAVRIDGLLVASVAAGPSGGTIGLGAYRAALEVGGLGVEELDSVPEDHPATATGCGWTPSTGTGSPQPVIVNQTGYDLGGPKRFTAPHALDGESFRVVDASDAVLFTGEIAGGAGDFSALNPASTGPFRILLDGAAGSGESYEFGIGANWTERVSYRNAIAFMVDARCFYGELAGQALNGTDPECTAGLAWRDSHQMSFEIPTLVDLYFANPSAIGAIRIPDAVYSGLEYPTSEDAPEVARLIAWAAEIYLRGQYDHALVKEQLASFLWAYPALADWIPEELYEAVRDYLFPIWSQATFSRYAWHDYTAHTADLLQVYTQVGTGKGEFPPGHSIVPNLRMWQVAEREGRADAEIYLDAAVAQAQWIVDHLDVADPAVTKGQRQGEFHLMTSLAELADIVPADRVPAGLGDFAERWADVAIERSDNMWDFRKYSDDRWTLPSFTGGGSGEDPNETGNLLGFPAAALAASTLIADAGTDARLAAIAQAQVDDVFGRNPTGRAAQYRINDPEIAFEGLDLGWYSEFQGGYGRLQGAHGVLEGSPKNAHYPFNPGVGNIGHSEGWVTFTTAWLESLAWRAYTATSVELDSASASTEATVTVTLRAPLNMDAAGGNTGTVDVAVNGVPAGSVVVTQTAINGLDYAGSIDLGALGVEPGDAVTVSYGLGSFEHSASLEVVEAGTDPGEGTGEPGAGDAPPTTVVTPQTPADFDPALELGPSAVRLVDGRLVADLGAGAAGAWFFAVVHSEPLELGWLRADAAGRVSVAVPSSLPAGAHTLALYDADGALAAFGSFVVAAADPGEPGSLSSSGTGEGAPLTAAVALAALALGVVALLRRRRRV